MTQAPLTDILVYLALSEEFDAVLAELSSALEPVPVSSLMLTAYRGNISSASTSYCVVVVPAGRMGNTCSAAIAAMLVAEFNPHTIVVLGIAGALSEDLLLGDVFVPEAVKEFLANSAAVADGSDWNLQLSGNEFPSCGQILNWFRNFRHTNAEMFTAWRERTKTLSENLVTAETREKLRENDISFEGCARLMAGEDRKLASGPLVGKGEQFAQWLKKFSDRKLVALEMESAGVYSACQLQRVHPKVVAIRGISDFADERKAKIERAGGTGFRELAARNATAALLCAIRSGVFEKQTAAQAKFPSENYYQQLVEWIDSAFRLKSWNHYSDYLIRGMVPFFFEEATRDLSEFVFRAIWPSSSPKLRDAVLNLSEHASRFVAFYTKHSQLSPFGNSFYVRDNFYDRLPYESPEKHMAARLFGLWSSTCIELLLNIVVALNHFGGEVRQSLNPDFHVLSGKFVLRDAQGVWAPSNLEETDYIPTEYSEAKKLLDNYAQQEAALEEYIRTAAT